MSPSAVMAQNHLPQPTAGPLKKDPSLLLYNDVKVM